jgi:hypothetical protein
MSRVVAHVICFVGRSVWVWFLKPGLQIFSNDK